MPDVAQRDWALLLLKANVSIPFCQSMSKTDLAQRNSMARGTQLRGGMAFFERGSYMRLMGSTSGLSGGKDCGTIWSSSQPLLLAEMIL